MAKISCKAKTATGKACRAPAMEGGLCFLHGNPESAKTLGQLGGRKNRRLEVIDIEMPEHMTLSDLRRMNAHAMHSVLSGKLHPRAATAIAQLSNAQWRVLQGAELEARIAMLEKQQAGGNASGESGEDADEAQVSLDDADQNAEAIGGADPEVAPVEPLEGDNFDPAARPDYLNTAEVTPSVVNNAGEEEGQPEQ